MTPRKPRPRTDILTPEEIGSILAAIGGGVRGACQRAIIIVLWRTGLRISECLDLMPGDLDREQSVIFVCNGKGSKSRWVVLDAQGWAEIDVWLAVRSTLAVDASAPLFCNSKGKRLLRNSFWETLKRLAAKAGIKKRVHPHIFRHTHAYELTKEQTPLPMIQQQLGHSSLAVTQRYTNHLLPADLAKQLQGRKWGDQVASTDSPIL